jgi:hypothetical protein
VSCTAVSGANTTSSWSWTPFEPFGSVSPTIWNRVSSEKRRGEEAARGGFGGTGRRRRRGGTIGLRRLLRTSRISGRKQTRPT